jgi:hypothetical protein
LTGSFLPERWSKQERDFYLSGDALQFLVDYVPRHIDVCAPPRYVAAFLGTTEAQRISAAPGL